MSCTLLKCISYYDLSVLSVSVMGGGWGELYLVLFCIFVFFLTLQSPLGRVHTTGLGLEPFRNRSSRPCSDLFHCVQSFRNEPTTSRCDRRGTVPERVQLALWCERATGPVPEPFQLPVTFVN